ncbi:MAG: hypothetical protein IPM82_25645 [Saprospiraceae bacterium]|nr:hypothetical protein [Saprospiraceae bacterium]
MQTITVELLDGQAMPKLQQMERQNLLRFVPSNPSELNPSARFEALFQLWKKETLFSSSGTEITNHPAYQAHRMGHQSSFILC